MSEKEEAAYLQGEKAMARKLLGIALHELNTENLTRERLIAERADAIATLRRICEVHGDNDWPDNLHLSDIIDKHLARYIEDVATNERLQAMVEIERAGE